MMKRTSFQSEGSSDEDEIAPSIAIKSSAAKRKAFAEILARCTVCCERIYPPSANKPKSALKHPVLSVLICQACSDSYTAGADNKDVQCLWCGKGGHIVCCHSCPHSFCRSCVVRHFGHAEFSRINDLDGEWKCFACDPAPLAPLIGKCEALLMDQKSGPPPKKLAMSGSALHSPTVGKPANATAASLSPTAATTPPTAAVLCTSTADTAMVASRSTSIVGNKALSATALHTIATWRAATSVRNLTSCTASAASNRSSTIAITCSPAVNHTPSAKAVTCSAVNTPSTMPRSQKITVVGSTSLTSATSRAVTVACNTAPAAAASRIGAVVVNASSTPATSHAASVVSKTSLAVAVSRTVAVGKVSTPATQSPSTVSSCAVTAVANTSASSTLLGAPGGKQVLVKLPSGNGMFKFNNVRVILPQRNGVVQNKPGPGPQLGTTIVTVPITTATLQAGSTLSTTAALSTVTSAVCTMVPVTLPTAATVVSKGSRVTLCAADAGAGVGNTSPAVLLTSAAGDRNSSPVTATLRPTADVGNMFSTSTTLHIAAAAVGYSSPATGILHTPAIVDVGYTSSATETLRTPVGVGNTMPATAILRTPVGAGIRKPTTAILNTDAAVGNTSPAAVTLFAGDSLPTSATLPSDSGRSATIPHAVTASTAAAITLSSSAGNKVLVKLKSGSNNSNFNKPKVQVTLSSKQHKDDVMPGSTWKETSIPVEQPVIQEPVQGALPPPSLQDHPAIKQERESPAPSYDNAATISGSIATFLDFEDKIQLSRMWPVNADNIKGILDELSLPVDLFESGFQMAQQLVASAKTLPPKAAASMYESAAYSFRTTLAAFLSSLCRMEAKAQATNTSVDCKFITVPSIVADDNARSLGPCIGTVTVPTVARKPRAKRKSRTKKAVPEAASSGSDSSSVPMAHRRIAPKVSSAERASCDTAAPISSQPRVQQQTNAIRIPAPDVNGGRKLSIRHVTSIRSAQLPRQLPSLSSLPRVVAKISSATLAKLRMRNPSAVAPSMALISSDSEGMSAGVAPIVIAPINGNYSDADD